MVGSWKINVVKNKYPQKVASAVADLDIFGAEYTPFAYLGSQEVNGTNHAVLAEQLVLSGRDTKNIVLLIFNEKANDIKASLVNIERVVESGGDLGGIKIDVKAEDFNKEKEVLSKAVKEIVGATIESFAFLGTQVTNGTNYIFAAKMIPVTTNPEEKVGVVIVNDTTKEIRFVDILGAGNADVATLGYAFNWLRKISK